MTTEARVWNKAKHDMLAIPQSIRLRNAQRREIY